MVVDGNIRFGLLAIKNVGRTLIERIVSERETNGPYTSFYNFCKRLQGRDLNRRALESLIKAGALDDFGYNRRELFTGIPRVLETLDDTARRNLEGQIGFFDLGGSEEEAEPGLDRMEDFALGDRLNMEMEAAGMYLSGNPLDEYRNVYKSPLIAPIGAILRSAEGDGQYRDDQRVTVFGRITQLKKKRSKNNSEMAFATLEDITGAMEVLVFPNVYAAYARQMMEGSILRMNGRISFTEEKEPKLLCDSIAGIPSEEELMPKKTPPERAAAVQQKADPSKSGLYLKFASEEDPRFKKAMQYLAVFDGATALFLYFEDTKKLKKAPASMAVDLNDVLLRELRRLLGDKNVAVRN